VLVLRPLLRGVPRGVDALFAGAPRAELATVMLVCPLVMNLTQAWIQDAYLKAHPAAGAPAGGLTLLHGGGGSGSGSSFSKRVLSLEAVTEARPSQEGLGCDGEGAGGAGEDCGDSEALLRHGAHGASPYRSES
jgi:hypothetical protein